MWCRGLPPRLLCEDIRWKCAVNFNVSPHIFPLNDAFLKPIQVVRSCGKFCSDRQSIYVIHVMNRMLYRGGKLSLQTHTLRIRTV